MAVSHIRYLAVILILSSIPMLWYGEKLISPLNLDLQINPVEYFEYVLYSWQSRSSLGTSLTGQGWIFPSSMFFLVLSWLEIPGYIAVRIWYVLTLFTAGTTMYFYARYFIYNYAFEFKCDLSDNDSHIKDIALLAAIVYIANPYVVMHFDNGHFLIPYSILPLQFLILDKGLKTGDIYYAVLLAISSVLVTTNLPIVVINYIALYLYAGYYLIVYERKFTFKNIKFLAVLSLFIFLNLLWFYLPTAVAILNNDTTISGAISQESWELYGRSSSFSETFRLLGIWGLYSGGYEYSNYYINNPLGNIFTYFVPILALFGLLISRKSFQVYFLLFLIVFAIFMAVGGHASSPFRSFYIFLYENVPFFSMFRNGYKFVSLLTFAYVLLISLLAFELKKNKWFLSKVHPKIIYISIILVCILSALPLFTGKMFTEKNLATIPSYWQDVSSWLNEDLESSRILLLPDQYFDTYRWGGWGGFTSSVPYINHDLIYNSPAKNNNRVIQSLYTPLSQIYNSATNWIRDDVVEGDYCQMIGSLNVKYIIQRNDIDINIYNVSPPFMVRSFLNEKECVEYSRSFGELDVYKFIGERFPKYYIKKTNGVKDMQEHQ